jgi:hypothetical protein
MWASLHAYERAEERCGVPLAESDFLAAVCSIIAAVMGEAQDATRLRVQHRNTEIWVVRLAGKARRVVYDPALSMIVTILPDSTRDRVGGRHA